MILIILGIFYFFEFGWSRIVWCLFIVGVNGGWWGRERTREGNGGFILVCFYLGLGEFFVFVGLV